MESFTLLLFAGKWLLVGLIYVFLIAVAFVVRREMALASGRQGQMIEPAGLAAPGYLQVINAGSDPAVQPGRRYPLKPETSLGAGSDNDLVLNDRFISAHHARLRWDGVAWWVEDLGSTNGTALNGRPIQARTPELIPAGGRLHLGDMVLELSE